MAKTVQDVVTHAFRALMISADDEAVTADQIAFGTNTLESLYEELKAMAYPTWDLTAVPDSAFNALARLLAVEIAPAYEVPARESRGKALVRLLALINPDDRADGVDTADPVYY